MKKYVNNLCLLAAFLCGSSNSFADLCIGDKKLEVFVDGTPAEAQLAHDQVAGQYSLTVNLAADKAQLVEVKLAGMPYAYGLGDAGGWSKSLNLVGDTPKSYRLNNGGGPQRWQSSFVIFPQNKFAGVVFDGADQVVKLGPEIYSIKTQAKGSVTFYFFEGEPEQIYKSYRALLTEKGYPHIKPKSRLFELGWESWAALGYQTNQETVLKSVRGFQEHGYPVRWAVTGSGFWEEGGTTTSFGKFGRKFRSPKQFKSDMHQRNVKWMIGMRTNFVLPGGPHIPKSKKRDFNLKGTFFNGNPLSEEGLEKDYFIKDAKGEPIVKISQWFPIVPCYVLDGHNKEAVDWYIGHYKKWDVDGIKEDTMMNLGSAYLGIFDQPMGRIAEKGDLVMARCGSFSSSGTLLRINDTKVNDFYQRTPINYLHYAACGQPNVYSDTVGFRKMKHYSDEVVRHAWLMALTAGLAVGEEPFHWTEKQQRIFKRPFDFHYEMVPTLYDAAIKSYHTGFPVTMTPLAIAYPNEVGALNASHFQWMAGESLLCAPLLKNHKSGKMDVYLPKGEWIDYDSGKKYKGPQLLKDFSMPREKTPCFVGGKGILVTRSADDAPLKAQLYPVDTLAQSFHFTHLDGESTTTFSQVDKKEQGVWDAKTGEAIDFEVGEKSGAIRFLIKPNQEIHFKP